MMQLSLLCGASAPALSQEPKATGDDLKIERLADERDRVLGEIESSLRSLEAERDELREQVAKRQIEEARAQAKAVEIEGKYQAIVSNLKRANENREEIVNHYRLYRHQERAKVVLPLLVGLTAYGLSHESGGDRLVEGFAGFGAASALEAAGYGLGKPIGMLTFKLTSW